jgi:hypothetical protein
MKYLQKSVVFMAFLLAAAIFLKCEKDDDITNPTITVNGTLE